MVIIGFSGTGKSVAIKHIVGLLEPDRRARSSSTASMCRYAAHAARARALRSKIGYVFQFAALFDSLTIGENVAMGLRKQGALRRRDR
jgi:phospholipid/cholesterol/gamma-HCH transport system ATP-binding protein